VSFGALSVLVLSWWIADSWRGDMSGCAFSRPTKNAIHRPSSATGAARSSQCGENSLWNGGAICQ
jgi:hypothetical protein